MTREVVWRRRPHSNDPDDAILIAVNYNDLSLINTALEVAIEKLGDWNGPDEYITMSEDMKPILVRFKERIEEFE